MEHIERYPADHWKTMDAEREQIWAGGGDIRRANMVSSSTDLDPDVLERMSGIQRVGPGPVLGESNV